MSNTGFSFAVVVVVGVAVVVDDDDDEDGDDVEVVVDAIVGENAIGPRGAEGPEFIFPPTASLRFSLLALFSFSLDGVTAGWYVANRSHSQSTDHFVSRRCSSFACLAVCDHSIVG